MLPPQHLDGLERLAWYRAARASEEERVVVEDLVRRQEAGERLAPHEEAKEAGPAPQRREEPRERTLRGLRRKIAAVPKEEADRERE